MYKNLLGVAVYLVASWCFSAQLSPIAKPHIISGLDDVLRQAENTGILKSALKLFEADKTFAGMPEFYQLMAAGAPEPKITLISAISTVFQNRIECFLLSNGFPASKFYFRSWLFQWGITDFKMNTIDQIIRQNPEKRFIVILDNSSASINFTLRIQKTYPEKVSAVYLRQVVLKPVPEKASPFYTAFDIAINEYTYGRLSFADVQATAAAILKVSEKSLIFPDYAQCPKDYEPCKGASKDSAQLCQTMKNFVRTLCLAT